MNNMLIVVAMFGSTLVHAEFIPEFPQGCAFATMGQSLPNTYVGYGRIQWMGSSFVLQYIDPNVPGPFAIAEIADNVGLIGQNPGEVSSVDLMSTPRDNYVVAQILDRSSMNLNPIVVCISPIFMGRIRSYMNFDDLPFGDDYFYSYRRYRYNAWDRRRWNEWDRWERSWRRKWRGRWDDRYEERRKYDRRTWEEKRRNPNLSERDRDWRREWRRDLEWTRDREIKRDRDRERRPQPKPNLSKPRDLGPVIKPQPEVIKPVDREPTRRPERRRERRQDEKQWQRDRQREGQRPKVNIQLDNDSKERRPHIKLNIDDRGEKPQIKLNIDNKNPNMAPRMQPEEDKKRPRGPRRGRSSK